MMRDHASTWFLIAVAGVALYLSYIIAKPFLNPIFAALVLAIVFYPLHARINSRLRRPNLAASISTVLVIFVIAIPAIFLGITVTRELREQYEWLRHETAAQGGLNPYLMHLMEAPLQYVGLYMDLSRFDVRPTLLGWIERASSYLVAIGASVVTNIFSFFLSAAVAFFTLFFLLRDGRKIQQRTAAILPLTGEQARKFITSVHETIIASVQGGIAVGLAQGSLTGLAFWVLGLSSPVLWGLVAAMASLIPFVGTGIIWAPAAVVLLLQGHWIKAILLLAWGSAVVAQADVVVRPYVVSGRAKIHNLLIFFALLGGMRAFGITGIFIGPVVLSITIVSLRMLADLNPLSQDTNLPGQDEIRDAE
ncbi:MAG TPA: AI-2E family transporter [Terriglobales bacterium]|jgi:predicted PurR-regulated permease PerM|nr:AI-2E family transporter [Terriglobales bacterium]